MLLIFCILGIIVWALWESHTTSKEYIERKNPWIVEQREQSRRINEQYEASVHASREASEKRISLIIEEYNKKT